ncbi:MAG TPA: hypothetical protein VFP59_04920 [Candidatus Angelobacter sp.]|nr:hypothetical protein [Candidatus Angelobacter sp.]
MPENSNTSSDDANTKRFNAALQTRQFEIDLVWKRSLFFWGFIAAAFVAIAALKTGAPGLSLLVSSFGLICSLAWTLANRGSKYWQEQWESKLEKSEIDVIGKFFGKRERRQRKGFWGGYPFSVSRLATLVSDFVFIVWLLIFIRQCFICFGWTPTQFDTVKPCVYTAIIIATAIAIIIVLCAGRSSPVDCECSTGKE